MGCSPGRDTGRGHPRRAGVPREVADDGDLTLAGAYTVPGTVGAVAPVEGDDGWVLAAGQGFVYLSLDGRLRPIVEVAPAGTRMNDGACDPQGRFWAGTLADDARPGGGALYRLDPDGHVEVMLDDLTISNGLGWSPDGDTMYLADSGPRLVYAFKFDQLTGSLSTAGCSSQWTNRSAHQMV